MKVTSELVQAHFLGFNAWFGLLERLNPSVHLEKRENELALSVIQVYIIGSTIWVLVGELERACIIQISHNALILLID